MQNSAISGTIPGGKTATVKTLGCRLNQSESLLMADKMRNAGYRVVDDSEASDLYLINTCTVTDRADAKCRSAINSAIRKNPNAIVVVAGCYSQMGYKNVARIPGVDLIIGNQQKLNFLDFVDDAKNESPLIVRDRIDREDFSISFEGEGIYNKRANIKIQDGCDFFCSFCIIPHARGRSRSRDWSNWVEEAESLASRGVRELVITGVNIGTYDSGGRTILDVVDRLNEVSGIDRIRISSIEPTTIPTQLFSRMNDPEHALLPFFHIPMQSGCDRILKAMYRKYDSREYFDFLELAASEVPQAYFGADIMVGFPGETEDEFEETCQKFLDSQLHFAHVFTYSERKGTPAKRSTEHVPMEERNRRSLHLRRLSQKKRHSFYEAHIGKTLKVLIEDPKPTIWTGLTDDYVRVCFSKDQCVEDITNCVVDVEMLSVEADFVEGRFVGISDLKPPVSEGALACIS